MTTWLGDVLCYSGQVGVSSRTAEERTEAFEISRPKSFDHNHWRQEMDGDTVDKIENTPVCRDFMVEMNYL